MAKLMIYLVRHGQTYFNKYGRFQGYSDIDLTPAGLEDAVSAGKRLANIQFASAYSSDLRRAENTALTILSTNKQTNPELVRLVEFREEFFGSFEGLRSVDVLAKIDPSLSSEHAYDQFIEKNGIDQTMDIFNQEDLTGDAENSSQFWERIDQGFKIIANDNPTDGNILLTVHGTVKRALADHYGQKEWSFSSVQNGAVSLLEFDTQTGNKKMITFNDADKIW